MCKSDLSLDCRNRLLTYLDKLYSSIIANTDSLRNKRSCLGRSFSAIGLSNGSAYAAVSVSVSFYDSACQTLRLLGLNPVRGKDGFHVLA